MSKSRELTGKLHLLCGASVFAMAFALSATAHAADSAKPSTAAKETQVAQNEPAPPAPAAEAEKPIEKVTVTGFRKSLRSALDSKKKSNSQIDAIKSEDIAKFPDLNLSEAIQRIPGVAISRDAGEGRNVTVRGLGPQFTRIRINGVEAMSTAGGTDAAGGTNRDRQFDFNVFAADLFNDVTVRKTGSAEVEEGSLGATIDLATPHPLDYGKFTMASSAQYGYNDLSESFDPRFAFLVSDTFGDGKFGALFSIAYSKRDLLEEGASTVRWMNGGTAANAFGPLDPAYVGTPTLAQINAAFRPRIPRYDIYQHEQERLGMTGSLQWRPSESTTVTLDGLYSKFEGTRKEIFLETPVFSTGGATGINNVNPVNAVIQDGSLIYGVFNDVDVRSEARYDELSTEFRQLTLNFDHDFSDRFRFNSLLGWSESDHQNPIQTTLLFDANDIDGYSYDFRQDKRLPSFTYGANAGGFHVTDPQYWTLSQIRLRPQTALNTFTGAQGRFEYDTADWLTLKAGLEWKKYEFETTELRRASETAIPAGAAGTPIANYSQLITLSGSGLNIPAGNTMTWLMPDLDAAAALFGLYDPALFPLTIAPARGNNRSVTEEDTGGFIQADFDFPELMGLRGNIGLRYVETRQSSTGWGTLAGVPTQITVERDYDDALPSLNLVLEPMDDFLIRFGASRVMARPGLGNLNPSAAVSAAGNNRTITGGNPQLDPFRADTADLAVEWYFEPQGLISVAGFYKDIGSFVQTVREELPNFAANPFGLPDDVAVVACGLPVPQAGCSPTATWQLSVPKNTPGGELLGYEINYQQPFSFMPAPFDNMGMLLNYTYVQTEIVYLNATGGVAAVDDLTNLSRRAYNATLYYEDETFSARVSAAYRSKYPTTIPGRDGNVLEATNETFNVDAAMSYALSDHVRLTFEGINLTDEVNDQYLNPDDRLSFYHHYGRQYFLGVRYSY